MTLATASIRIERAADAGESTLAADVRAGLTRAFKALPPKHLYDERGSELFDAICELPEYYPTRTERTILTASADSIAARTGATELVELGSGSASKTRVLLDALLDAGTLRGYVPFDIAETVVRDSARALLTEYPELSAITGVVGDFERDLGLVPDPEPDSPRILALLGGTIGNFAPLPRRRLLHSMAALVRPGDHVLIGVDLVKDPAVIEAAYNDAAGVTAEFNRNLLAVINRELDADFPLEEFEHVAFFDTTNEWIEMRLRAQRACVVEVAALDLTVAFKAGEELQTEISAKFTPARIESDLAACGLHVVELYTDPDELFGLVLAAPGPVGG